MKRNGRLISQVSVTLAAVLFGAAIVSAQASTTEFRNGRWFNGSGFVTKTFYSVDGRFTETRPQSIERSIDLGGLWMIPPLAEAHNHNIATGVEEWDRKAVANYLRDGVFYVKIQGNLPITQEELHKLGVNDGRGIDAQLAQGTITGAGGHPIGLIEEILLRRGYFPGFSKDTLRDHRYFTVDSENELDRKWASVLSKRPDFIKVLLWASDEHTKRAISPDHIGQRALDPALLPLIVQKARAAGLGVSAHVTTAADFHIAVAAGVDEINHLPYLGSEPISEADAKLAAEKKIVVVTTVGLIERLPKNVMTDAELAGVRKAQITNLRRLFEHKVPLAIGSDNPSDTSVDEAFYLNALGIFDTATLLKMWTETTAQAIFPDRKVGRLAEGYEANFLALEADPLADLSNVKRITYRFKQGVLIEPTAAGN